MLPLPRRPAPALSPHRHGKRPRRVQTSQKPMKPRSVPCCKSTRRSVPRSARLKRGTSRCYARRSTSPKVRCQPTTPTQQSTWWHSLSSSSRIASRQCKHPFNPFYPDVLSSACLDIAILGEHSMHVTIADYGPDHALRNKDEAEVYGRALHARQQALCALQGQSTPGRAGHLWRDDCEC